MPKFNLRVGRGSAKCGRETDTFESCPCSTFFHHLFELSTSHPAFNHSRSASMDDEADPGLHFFPDGNVDLYGTLGVAKEATQEDIKKAYKK